MRLYDENMNRQELEEVVVPCMKCDKDAKWDLEPRTRMCVLCSQLEVLKPTATELWVRGRYGSPSSRRLVKRHNATTTRCSPRTNPELRTGSDHLVMLPYAGPVGKAEPKKQTRNGFQARALPQGKQVVQPRPRRRERGV